VKKNRLILLLVAILALGSTAYLSYRIFWKGRSYHPLELVAADAIFVFETTEPVMAWNQLVSQPIWNRLVELPSINNAQKQLLTLDSLVGRSGNLDRSLRGNQLAVSLHPVSKEEFDFLYTISFNSSGSDVFIEKLEQNLPPLTRIVTRSYANTTIKEVQHLDVERNFTYARINNCLVGSYTSFLVEEAIRLSQNNNEANFRNKNPQLIKAVPKPSGLGVVRLSTSGIARLFGTLSRDTQLPLTKRFEDHDISANLELGFADNKILLTGYSYFSNGAAKDFSASVSRKNTALAPYISNRTAVFVEYNNAKAIQNKLFENKGFQPISTLKGDVEKQLVEQGFLDKLKDEVGHLMFETVSKENQDQILLLKTESLSEQLALLKKFSFDQKVEEKTESTVDYYLDKEIFMISSQEFPAHLFSGRFKGFDDTYVTGWGDLLVFANSSKAIKLFLDDFSSDFTWGKSLQQKSYLESISGQAGVNVVINIPKVWNSIIESSTPSWRAFFQKYGPQLKSIDQVSVRVNDENGKNHMSVALSYHLDPFKTVQDVILTENKSVQFKDQLVYGPKPIQNFTDRSLEFVLQDEQNQLYLLTSEGESIFTYGLDGRIVSDIFQIDYFRNGKLQLLFATAGNVYVIDRLGNLLTGFPLSPSSEPITHLNLVDYSNTKDYRFFVSNSRGELFLLDKTGNTLEGWGPKQINSTLAVKPAHHRIAGIGDHMVALGQKGDLYFFNRRGEALLGSPIHLGEGLSTNYVIIERGSAKETRLVTVTKEGEVVQANFLGEITFRNQLLRPDRESRFHLIKDQKEDRYLFVVHEYNKISVLDQELKVLFEKTILSDQLGFQFFSFGSDKNIFVVSDSNQDFVYLYNLKGELLNTRPISGSGNIELRYAAAQNEYVIYVRDEFSFKEYKLPL
jgi:hypothetical protein